MMRAEIAISSALRAIWPETVIIAFHSAQARPRAQVPASRGRGVR